MGHRVLRQPFAVAKMCPVKTSLTSPFSSRTCPSRVSYRQYGPATSDQAPQYVPSPAAKGNVRRTVTDCGPTVKEMTDIKLNGCPPGIEPLNLESTDTWIFKVAVLGDETVYRVSAVWCLMAYDTSLPEMRRQRSLR